MDRDERAHWNERYRGDAGKEEPAAFLTGLNEILPSSGRALDVAGGIGRNAHYLASRGLDVTLIDISDVALDRAAARADAVGFELTTVRVDLARAPLPEGPWDVITCFHYLQRDLFPAFAAALASNGLLICSIATAGNLARHERPPRPFVLEPGELPGLVSGLIIELFEEGWYDDHHEAHLVARRPG